MYQRLEFAFCYYLEFRIELFSSIFPRFLRIPIVVSTMVFCCCGQKSLTEAISDKELLIRTKPDQKTCSRNQNHKLGLESKGIVTAVEPRFNHGLTADRTGPKWHFGRQMWPRAPITAEF